MAKKDETPPSTMRCKGTSPTSKVLDDGRKDAVCCRKFPWTGNTTREVREHVASIRDSPGSQSCHNTALIYKGVKKRLKLP